jgi:hypothetical protein
MGVWKQVGQQLGGLAKHAATAVVTEPLEIAKDMVGQKMEQGQQTQQQTTDDPGTSDPLQDLAKAGFKTQDDFTKYQGLSGQKDQMEVAMLRKQLVRDWGLDTNLESGMQQARMEWEQKEAQRKQVQEKEEEQQKAFEFQKKQQDDVALTAAKSEASAEQQAWGAG